MSSPMALPASAKDVESGLLFYFTTITTLTSILLAISTITVLLRLHVRLNLTHTFSHDDTAMLLAWLAWLTTCILTYICIHSETLFVRTGHLNMPITRLVQIIRFSNAAYSLTMILVKLSLAFYFLKLFTPPLFRPQRLLILASTALTTALGTAYLVFTVASCGIMVQSQKTTPFRTGSDWCPVQESFVRFSVAWSVVNALTDALFAGLAVNVVWGAKMAASTKASAIVLVLFGCVGGVASCVRVAVQLPLGDIRIAGVLLGLWSNVEAGVSITAASLITLRPLFQSVSERVKGSFGGSKAAGSEGESAFGKGTGKSGRSVGYASRKSGHKGSDSASTSSSMKEVLEMEDLEEGPREKVEVVVTRTWTVNGREGEWERR
ncbi:hypothetical protein BDZ85DRAFT_320656, partial [Elsinoe ampelina]